jgi:hypothetical protein
MYPAPYVSTFILYQSIIENPFGLAAVAAPPRQLSFPIKQKDLVAGTHFVLPGSVNFFGKL